MCHLQLSAEAKAASSPHNRDIPPSFDGQCGKVVYFLEAKLNRPKRISSKDRTEFTVLSMTDVRDPDMKVTSSDMLV